MGERLLENILNHLGIHFARLVIEGFTLRIQYDDMRNVAHVVLLDQAAAAPAFPPKIAFAGQVTLFSVSNANTSGLE